jgi:hypothetical protein
LTSEAHNCKPFKLICPSAANDPESGDVIPILIAVGPVTLCICIVVCICMVVVEGILGLEE